LRKLHSDELDISRERKRGKERVVLACPSSTDTPTMKWTL
jgi:hypothetical protein